MRTEVLFPDKEEALDAVVRFRRGRTPLGRPRFGFAGAMGMSSDSMDDERRFSVFCCVEISPVKIIEGVSVVGRIVLKRSPHSEVGDE